MKSAFVVTAVGAFLFASASITNAQDAQQRAQPFARSAMQDDANASAQSSTDMSYGGVVATRREAGGPLRPTTWAYARQRDLFSKH
ncbi:hypothetical protein AX768_30870 (plasmid) [Burkholderia sp. PAMC 28687]|uniref:hypothetical protein n=1 Tax=Burkholderia sp. PAMC 28687 TaxID=1795874 RepID=UPI000781C183|nr:hypothetical protein [Burkholderia sp. PAMC 28687]AMM18623.1 hypothetical protein AX768_30870 [Burkholderia sp. PAMC 28687]